MEKQLGLFDVLSTIIQEQTTEVKPDKFNVYKNNIDGWKLIKKSNQISDFTSNDRWYFEKMLKQNRKSIKVGNTMYSIEK